MNLKVAEFASKLVFESLPPEVVRTLKHSFIDALACALYGSSKPWSKKLRDVVVDDNSSGNCAFPTFPRNGLPASNAALLMGAYCHAFEQDNLRFPGAGVHPGAAIMCPLLALAQEHKLSGKQLLVSAAAGLEALSRLGVATKHSLERRGFHAPGVIGPVGGAIACASALGASSKQILDASGIAASMSGGILAFSKSKAGGMVKRLHLGRSAEASVKSAQLAMKGFEGPETAIDGHFGLLEAFCPEYETAGLDEALGTRWESSMICFKSFPIHITAHAPLMAAKKLLETNEINLSGIVKIRIFGSEKIVSHHRIYRPADIMQAQYSVPFCLAAGLVVDLRDPDNFNESLLNDLNIQRLLAKIELRKHDTPAKHSWHARVEVEHTDGATFDIDMAQFKGMPSNPFDETDISEKYLLLAKRIKSADKLLEDFFKLEKLSRLPDFSGL